VKREHGVGFSTRMGLNSGDVVVGRIGDDLRMDYTAQGHIVGQSSAAQVAATKCAKPTGVGSPFCSVFACGAGESPQGDFVPFVAANLFAGSAFPHHQA
jgi:hypothetical protein